MQKAEFLARYGGIYEHSPWIAEAAFAQGARTRGDIQAAMRAAVEKATKDQKLALICAHPDLACATRDLTASSTAEQTGAGLKECTPEEFDAFQRLNAEYKKKFGFPFIIAVKGLHRSAILEEFRRRINGAAESEFRTALEQIHKIAQFRLEALTSDAEDL